MIASVIPEEQGGIGGRWGGRVWGKAVILLFFQAQYIVTYK